MGLASKNGQGSIYVCIRKEIKSWFADFAAAIDKAGWPTVF